MFGKNLKLESKITTTLRNALLRPVPRVTEGRFLVDNGVRAAIDISDGLLADLQHICRASRVGAWIEADRIPIEPAVRAGFDEHALELALTGGEDYELLFTAGTEHMEKLVRAASCPIHVIGEVVHDHDTSSCSKCFES